MPPAIPFHGTIADVPGIAVGHWTNTAAATGCTVILFNAHPGANNAANAGADAGNYHGANPGGNAGNYHGANPGGNAGNHPGANPGGNAGNHPGDDSGAVGGVAVRGGSPGTRETDLLHPMRRVQRMHAVVFSGGSAFGLAAADGVQRWLAERNIGFPTAHARVPIVPAAILYDLGIGSPNAPPDAAAGYAACTAAMASAAASTSASATTQSPASATDRPPAAATTQSSASATTRPPASATTQSPASATTQSPASATTQSPAAAPLPTGSVGAGTGATVAKMWGMNAAVKGGFGSARCLLPGGVSVAAAVAVNAWGGIRDYPSGCLLAGPRQPDGTMCDPVAALLSSSTSTTATGSPQSDAPVNTTIGIVATDAPLDKMQANFVASAAHDGLALTIHPCHTPGDGDTIFCAATGRHPAPPDLTVITTAAVAATAQAVLNAIRSATGLAGVPAIRELGLPSDR